MSAALPLPARLDTQGPRYTSYPTADRFGDAFGPSDLLRAMHERKPAPLSVYVHIPFCESVCYYCACNKVITKHHERATPYLDALGTEIGLYHKALGGRQPVTQMHFGGGTPTFLSDEELTRLMGMLAEAFDYTDDAEVSIEVDPRTADPGRLAHLRRLGFNRLSFGVQDFDPDVQQAVHRVQSYESVEALIVSARELGFVSTNVDLIYGLPKQTAESFARTIAQVSALRPDRIALYAYAHLPERFKPQRRINADELPEASSRLQMLRSAIQSFGEQGYDAIGMDHFALSTDSLAVAKREGRLHRNFQGYSTRPDCDLVGLGVSAIGRIGPTYAQNAKTLAEYHEAVDRAELPVIKGLWLDADDLMRRDAIMALMCRGRLEHSEIERGHGVVFAERFAAELGQIQAFVDMGLVTLEPGAIQVTPDGWNFVRAIAMVFDKYVRAPGSTARFSRIA
ncbi:MAG: oxygen-independent coproporphyrinogen III oxidase [Rhizobacter sp.]